MSRRPRSFAVAFALVSLVLAACNAGDGGDPKNAMQSAGGLSESRLPHGPQGVSPAPTGALPRDKALEAGWLKRAKHGEKPPSAGDRASLLTSRTVPHRPAPRRRVSSGAERAFGFPSREQAASSDVRIDRPARDQQELLPRSSGQRSKEAAKCESSGSCAC